MRLMIDSAQTRSTETADNPGGTVKPTFREALRFWGKLGLISFGGPAGQIAIMHTELVERKRWISENRFLHALNFCMLLPGPEAQQLAIYVGWLLHRTRGGIAAGVLFVLPSALLIWILSYIYVIYGHIFWVEAIFTGLKPVILAVVAAAVIRIGKKALKNRIMWVIATLAFVAIFFFKAPFPAIVIGAGLTGWLGSRLYPDLFVTLIGHDEVLTSGASQVDFAPSPKPTPARTLKVFAICAILWATPIFIAGQVLGWQHTVTKEGIFFSKAATVTFGGAYAVLPYVAQQAVDFQWLAPHQMLDGLALAETTPGPLIMVLQFVGFIGGWQHPGDLSPLLSATLGALITSWVTFVPCFLWIFLGAPYVEQLHGHAGLTGALSTITAAVVGVILNLAVWLGIHVLFPTDLPSNWFGIVICTIAFIAMVRWKIDVHWIVIVGCIIGVLHYFVMTL